MIVRPYYCINNKCELYQTAIAKVVCCGGSVSEGQNYFNNELLENNKCKKCKKQFLNEFQRIVKSK